MSRTRQIACVVPLVTRFPPALCGNVFKEILKTSVIGFGTVSKGLQNATRYLSLSNSRPINLQCCNCDSLFDNQSHSLNSNWINLTAVEITFANAFSSEQLHVAASLSQMFNLRRLAMFGLESSESIYSQLSRSNSFVLDYFGCDCRITEGLVKFLAVQAQLIECSIIAPERVFYEPSFCKCFTKLLSNVTLLQTTAPLLIEAVFNLSSVRRLEYIGDSNDLQVQIAAVRKIYQLGPQLESLRFSWDTGTLGTFLDLTKFVRIAKRTTALRYLQLINVDKRMFEEFVAAGIHYETWSRLETLIWDPVAPCTAPAVIDTVSADGRSIVTISRKSHKASTVSGSSSWSFSSLDHNYRMHCISRDLMTSFRSLYRFAMWNWMSKGHDVMRRGADRGLSWTYGLNLDEDEWMNA